MLAQTVKDNLKDINNLKMRTKAARFSTLFQTVPTVGGKNMGLRQVLMREGLIEICEDELVDEVVVENTVEEVVEDVVEETSDVMDFDIVEEGDELYEIVENPDELVVSLPVISVSDFENRLPFFKSVSLKLASL
ncbi:hypothetical protein IJ472_02745 [bacterium]|nr:hypothetical protein [bacterium]